MKIYLTRHGQTEWNLAERLQGWKDSNLTEKGIKNAIALRDRLKNVKLDIIVSSPSIRTRKTSEIIANDRDIEIRFDDKLREIHSGAWDGKFLSDIKRLYPKEHYEYWNKPHLYKGIDGAETFSQVQKRAMSAIKEVISGDKYEDILVVTHGVTLKVIMAYFENRPIEKLWDSPHIYDTSLSLVKIDRENVDILLHGDISHLEEK